MKQHIVFISSNYPNEKAPYRGVFVQNLVKSLADLDFKCSVITPIQINESGIPYNRKDISSKGNSIQVLSPRYLSLSNKKIFGINTYKIMLRNFSNVVTKSLNDLEYKPDIIYGHFLYPNGQIAAKIGKEYNIPSFVAVGESGTNLDKCINDVGIGNAKKDFENISGIISVSTLNKKFCQEKLCVPESKIKVIPNGVNKDIFKQLDKVEMREKYGFPLDKTIVAFTGHFNERKGPHRLLQAIEGNENIKVIFIGTGAIPLHGENILFKGILQQTQMKEILSCADMFVLPTLAEGCCNAIIEAMACGLPIVSSLGEFNDDILDESYSIRVDPNSVSEIRRAILTLNNNVSLRNEMSKASLAKSNELTLEERSKKISKWINDALKI